MDACKRYAAGCRTCARCWSYARRDCGFGLLFCRDARLHFFASLAVSFLIELSQLWHPPFLEALRATTVGGLVLGYGFLWSDLICYTVGAFVCALAETILRKALHFKK